MFTSTLRREPAQVVLYGLAAALVALALRGRPAAHRAISVGLGLLWVWTGVAYHLWHFTAINPPAWGFGALFVVQGALFIGHGIGGRRLEFGRPRGLYGWIGGVLVTYALVVYPLWGLASGHPAQEIPVLGVPSLTEVCHELLPSSLAASLEQDTDSYLNALAFFWR